MLIIYLKEWKNCYDFLSEQFSIIVVLDQSNQEMRLVVKMGPERLFIKQIVREPVLNRFQLELT